MLKSAFIDKNKVVNT